MELSFKDFTAVRDMRTAYQGYDTAQQGWVIPMPVNPHTHLRDPIDHPDMFELAVPETAKLYAWATAMPNLGKNRIRTPEQAIAYREKILEIGRKLNPIFDVTVPLFVESDTDPSVVLDGFKRGAWKTMKVYPRNGTTESDFGVDFRKFEAIYPVIEMAEKLGILVLIHGEVVHHHDDSLVDDRFREELALKVVDDMLKTFPKTKVVFEHLSSEAGVHAIQFWQARQHRVEATVAPQYLFWNSTKLFERGMNPESFSIPILKTEVDRRALVHFVLNGGGMLGTDSAPHDVAAKSKPKGCPGGVFNEPTGLFSYFHLFRASGKPDWFEKFVDFSSGKASKFYDELVPVEKVAITEQSWVVPQLYERGSTKVIPMLAGTTMPYALKSL
jgi:dihydroorotase